MMSVKRFIPYKITVTALLCMAVLVLSISCQRKVSSFDIIVENKGLEFPVRLLRIDTTGVKNVDSLLNPAKGSFKFKVQSQNAYAYLIQSGNRQTEFVAGPGDTVVVDFASQKLITKENVKYVRFREYIIQTNKLEKQADSLALIFNSAQITDSFPQVRERLNGDFNSLLLKARNNAVSFIENDSTLAIFIAISSKLRQSFVLNYAVKPKIFLFADSVLITNYPTHPYSMWLHNFMNFNKIKYGDLPQENIKEGQVLAEIKLPGLNNKTITVHPEKGEIALLYFWDESAVSRKANASVRLLNEKYKANGLKIYAISFMENKQEWPSLIEVDKMWWTNMIDERSLNSPLLKEFNIKRLPYFIITDENRKVIANFGNTAELNEWAISHFSK